MIHFLVFVVGVIAGVLLVPLYILIEKALTGPKDLGHVPLTAERRVMLGEKHASHL